MMRKSADFGGATASVTAAKRTRLLRSTRYLWMLRPELSRMAVRFDALLLNAAEAPVDWIQGAFD